MEKCGLIQRKAWVNCGKKGGICKESISKIRGSRELFWKNIGRKGQKKGDKK